jgi:hypothetical protein
MDPEYLLSPYSPYCGYGISFVSIFPAFPTINVPIIQTIHSGHGGHLSNFGPRISFYPYWTFQARNVACHAIRVLDIPGRIPRPTSLVLGHCLSFIFYAHLGGLLVDAGGLLVDAGGLLADAGGLLADAGGLE